MTEQDNLDAWWKRMEAKKAAWEARIKGKPAKKAVGKGK